MRSEHERQFFSDVVQDSLSKILKTCLPGWRMSREIKQIQQDMVSVGDVERAIDAMPKITAQINAFALEGACVLRGLAEVAGCALAWDRFECLTESRELRLRTLRDYVRRRTSSWRRVMLPVDMDSVIVAYHLIKYDEAEFTAMLATLKAKSQEVQKTLVAQYMKYETKYLTLYRRYSILERYYKGVELEGLQRGHFIRQGDVGRQYT